MTESTRTLMASLLYPAVPILGRFRATFPTLEWVPANTSQKWPLTFTGIWDIQVIMVPRAETEPEEAVLGETEAGGPSAPGPAHCCPTSEVEGEVVALEEIDTADILTRSLDRCC